MANGAFTLQGFESPEEVQARIGKAQGAAFAPQGNIDQMIYQVAAQGQAGMGGALAGALGYEDPQVKKARARQESLAGTDFTSRESIKTAIENAGEDTALKVQLSNMYLKLKPDDEKFTGDAQLINIAANAKKYGKEMATLAKDLVSTKSQKKESAVMSKVAVLQKDLAKAKEDGRIKDAEELQNSITKLTSTQFSKWDDVLRPLFNKVKNNEAFTEQDLQALNMVDLLKDSPITSAIRKSVNPLKIFADKQRELSGGGVIDLTTP